MTTDNTRLREKIKDILRACALAGSIKGLDNPIDKWTDDLIRLIQTEVIPEVRREEREKIMSNARVHSSPDGYVYIGNLFSKKELFPDLKKFLKSLKPKK